MLDTLQAQLAVGATLCVAGMALLKGGKAERAGGAASAASVLPSLLLQEASPASAATWALIGLNVALLVVYAALAWKSRRSWPVWACALQALIVMTHLLSLSEGGPPLLAFHAVTTMAGFGVLLALAIGTLQVWRDRRTFAAA